MIFFFSTHCFILLFIYSSINVCIVSISLSNASSIKFSINLSTNNCIDLYIIFQISYLYIFLSGNLSINQNILELINSLLDQYKTINRSINKSNNLNTSNHLSQIYLSMICILSYLMINSSIKISISLLLMRANY